MDFVNGSLPNLMFIAGLMAIGIGLGIEFKIIEVKGELSKNARIGACALGGFLILASIFFYARPLLTATAPAATPQPTVVQAAAVLAAPGGSQVGAPALASAAAASPTVPPTNTSVPPTATPEPTATPVPPTVTPEPTATLVPPTVTPEPPTVTPEPAGIEVPDIRGQESKDAKRALEALGLQLGEKKDKCEDIGVRGDDARKVKKGRITCQSPLPGSLVPMQTQIVYVLAD